MEAKIEALNKKMMEAYNSRDFDGMASLYDDYCQVMPAKFPIVYGPQDAGEFWKGVANDTLYKMELKTEEIWGPMKDAKGETAIERGVCTFYNNENIESGQSKYIVVWKKVGDEWRILIDIWNSDT